MSLSTLHAKTSESHSNQTQSPLITNNQSPQTCASPPCHSEFAAGERGIWPPKAKTPRLKYSHLCQQNRVILAVKLSTLRAGGIEKVELLQRFAF